MASWIFLAIKKCGVHKLMAITADLVAGHPVNEKDCVLHLQAREFRIETEGELPSDLDGEEGPMLPLTIETIPQAVAIYC